MNGNDLKEILESAFPLSLQEELDNSGLQIGTFQLEVSKILISLDITNDIIDEAITKNANVIITHHPLFYHSINQIDTENNFGLLIKRLLDNNIFLYSVHTNFDSVQTGMGYQLSKSLNLSNSKPFIMVSNNEGFGVIGYTPRQTIKDYINLVKRCFKLDTTRFIGTLTDEVEKVVLLPGSGKDYLKEAKKVNADLYITGDISYHYAVEAKEMGLNVLDIGHFAEHIGLIGIKELLDEKVTVETIISERMKDPYTFI